MSGTLLIVPTYRRRHDSMSCSDCEQIAAALPLMIARERQRFEADAVHYVYTVPIFAPAPSAGLDVATQLVSGCEFFQQPMHRALGWG